MSEQDKQKARMIQNFEQAAMAMEPFANFISVYFKNLVSNGFTREEATKLADSFAKMVWTEAFRYNENNNRFEEQE